MRYLLIIGTIIGPLCFLIRPPCGRDPAPTQEMVRKYFIASCNEYENWSDTLFLAIKNLNHRSVVENKNADERVRLALRQCRLRYKRFSFLLDYFFPQSAWALNAPARTEVEEPEMEFEVPHGMQEIESLIYQKPSACRNKQLLEQANLVKETAHGLKALAYGFVPSDPQVMESVHLELLRVMTLYVEGFDAPLLRSGIDEAHQSLSAVRIILDRYRSPGDTSTDKAIQALDNAINYLSEKQSFEHFDRLTFLSRYAIPCETQITSVICKKGWLNQSHPSLDYTKGLFDGEVVRPYRDDKSEIVYAGRRLFSDPALSGQGQRSCASCHQPGRYFTDGLQRNLTPDHKNLLARNTPTLLYSAYQSAQSWDGRAASLEEQIRNVITDPLEMDGDTSVILQKLIRDTAYQVLDLSGDARQKRPAMQQVTHAIAAYVSTLSSLSSPFDRYMHGDNAALSNEQKRGANLFLGKAQCGTCHFMPFFNGSTPPLFNKSEFEVLGTPADQHFGASPIDGDRGRFNVFPIKYYKGAFKTPTLRNITKTAPYMHHGAFTTLDSVVAFYNKGGGRGLGLKVPNQTLDNRPLGLTRAESTAIIAFLRSLTDAYTKE